MIQKVQSAHILDEIFAHKRLEVEASKRGLPGSELRRQVESAPPTLDFAAALMAPGLNKGPAFWPALIAEVKRGSPSAGLLAREFDPAGLAQVYEQNGAAAISVVTDERFFGGSLENLRRLAARSPRLPLLRKEFIYDPYQVYESRAAGADALLLIAAALSPGQLSELHALALELGMAPLVEVHNRIELETALDIKPCLVGINNRDLRDFSIRLETTLELRPHVPPGITIVAESGVHTPADVQRLSSIGIHAVLVGTALVTASDIARQVRLLAGKEAG